MIHALDLTENDVCVIHYDRSRPAAEHRKLRELISAVPGVIWQRPRKVAWGGYSLIAAQIEGIQIALNHSDKWTHWINLSGQCFPLQTPECIRSYFEQRQDLSLISHFDPFIVWNNTQTRIGSYYLNFTPLDRLFRFPGIGRRLRGWCGQFPCLPIVHRPPPHFFRYYGSSNWVSLARRHAALLTSSPKARRVSVWLRWSLQPEEALFPSVLLNLDAHLDITPDNGRYIIFEPGAVSPRTFTKSDIPALMGAICDGRLFARKFDEAVDPAPLAEIAKMIAIS